jgi:hypothetical protein
MDVSFAEQLIKQREQQQEARAAQGDFRRDAVITGMEEGHIRGVIGDDGQLGFQNVSPEQGLTSGIEFSDLPAEEKTYRLLRRRMDDKAAQELAYRSGRTRDINQTADETARSMLENDGSVIGNKSPAEIFTERFPRYAENLNVSKDMDYRELFQKVRSDIANILRSGYELPGSREGSADSSPDAVVRGYMNRGAPPQQSNDLFGASTIANKPPIVREAMQVIDRGVSKEAVIQRMRENNVPEEQIQEVQQYGG